MLVHNRKSSLIFIMEKFIIHRNRYATKMLEMIVLFKIFNSEKNVNIFQLSKRIVLKKIRLGTFNLAAVFLYK